MVSLLKENKQTDIINSLEPIKIGAVLSISGPAASVGEAGKIGIELATELINKEGGIDGRPLEVIIEDSQTNPQKGTSAFTKLVEVDDVEAVVVQLSSISLAVQPIAEEHQIPILAESTHPTIVHNFDYTLRNFYRSDVANDELVDFITSREYKKISVLHINDEFGNVAIEDLEDKALKYEWSIVSKDSFSRADTDLRSQITKAKVANPDLVYIVGFGPTVALAYNQMQELDLTSEKVGFIICGQPDIVPAAKEALEGTYAVEAKFDELDQNFIDLNRLFKKRYPKLDINQSVVVSYDAIRLFADALRSGAQGGLAIRDYLLNIDDFSGASGPITFDRKGESSRAMELQKIVGGECVDL